MSADKFWRVLHAVAFAFTAAILGQFLYELISTGTITFAPRAKPEQMSPRDAMAFFFCVATVTASAARSFIREETRA